MTSAQDIVQMYEQRRQQRGGLLSRMEDVRRHYNGDVIVPLPELDENEKPAVANLIAQGIDQYAMRVASVLPDIVYPSVRPGFAIHDERARERRLANLGWWDMNKMGMKLRRRARYLNAYGCSPVTLSPVALNPSDKRQMPFWRVRNPLSAFPSRMVDEDDIEPTDCIFVESRTLGWLQANYPGPAARLYKGKGYVRDKLFEILEYVDADETVIVVKGSVKEAGIYHDPANGVTSLEELERVPNRAGICPVVFPGRITLDRLQGRFDQMLGMYQRQAKLDALNTIAVFRSVFPDEWAQSHPNAIGAPEIIVEADGLTGQRGEIKNGTLQVVQHTPNPAAEQAMDRYERAQRLTAGMPPEMGGEGATNIRTARRGEMVMGAAIDMPIQEDQEILAASLKEENLRAVKIMKAYYGSKPSMFILPGDGKVTQEQYTPETTFDQDFCYVKYAVSGSDVNGLVIGIGQRVGAGWMSLQTGMEMDPAIEDPEREREQIALEGLRKAMLSGSEAQASQGTLDPSFIARVASTLASKHIHLEDAFLEAHKAMQAEQAATQAQQQPGAPPTPEAMPGAAGMPPPPPSINPPTQGTSNLADLLQRLRRPANQGPAERQMSQAAG